MSDLNAELEFENDPPAHILAGISFPTQSVLPLTGKVGNWDGVGWDGIWDPPCSSEPLPCTGECLEAARMK